MSNIFSLTKSDKLRKNITKQIEYDISKMYQDMSDKFSRQVKSMSIRSVSDSIKQLQLIFLANELKEKSRSVSNDIQSTIKNGMYNVSGYVVGDANRFNSLIGLSELGAYGNVPTDVVASIISGSVYSGNWTLSRAIWNNYDKIRKDIDYILAKGVAEGKGVFEIAKDLERYVNPSATKMWDWSKVYPGTNKKIEYNSQRLARTLISHAYQQSIIVVCKDNPFVDGIKWLSANTERTCEVCLERDGVVYPKDALPLDHPNGLCSYAPEVSKTYDEISNGISSWLGGEENKDLDDWYNVMFKK